MNKALTLATELNELTKDYDYSDILNGIGIYLLSIGMTLIDEDIADQNKLQEMIKEYQGSFPGYILSISASLFTTTKILEEKNEL